MKEYNRTTKKWEEAVDIKLKKRELCRGGKEHDYVLILPWGYEHIEGLYIDAEPLYKAQDTIRAMQNTLDEELLKVGIKRTEKRFSDLFKPRREYMCSVCKKKKYD